MLIRPTTIVQDCHLFERLHAPTRHGMLILANFKEDQYYLLAMPAMPQKDQIIGAEPPAVRIDLIICLNDTLVMQIPVSGCQHMLHV